MQEGTDCDYICRGHESHSDEDGIQDVESFYLTALYG